MEEFKVAVSSWSSFPVINHKATSQLLFKMLHPRAQAPSPSLLCGDPSPRSSVTILWPDTQVGHPGWRGVIQAREQTPGCLGAPFSVISGAPSTALGGAGCA